MTRRSLFWLLLADLFLGIWFFQDGLWGGSMLAPLDCGPTLMPKFQFMDPASGAVPRNHHIIDQFTFDLPYQHEIYHALRRGEMPWWNPYTFSGQPFMADAHVNTTDPARLFCYFLLPFELAYNWTLVLHWLLSGLGMFLVLRRWRFDAWICVGLALAWQLAACHTHSWGHPWLRATFLYYPVLWWAWERWADRPHWKPLCLASLLTGLIFYTGNLQSHAYLVLFAVAFLFGYAGRSLAALKRILPGVMLSGIIGAALSLPVVLNEIEFFLRGIRHVASPEWKANLSGLISLAGVYPWVTGSFRTLDWGKYFSHSGLAYFVFIGSIAFALAGLGMFLRPSDPTRQRQKRMALGLVALYFCAILSTPLQAWLYWRSAAVGVLGLLVLAAIGLEEMLRQASPLKKTAWVVVVVAVVSATAANLEGWFIYPRHVQQARIFVEKCLQVTPALDSTPALRNFQIENFPNEVTFQNPETIWAFLGLLSLAAFAAFPRLRSRRWSLPALLVLNLVPLASYDQRFLPRHPVEMWHRLLAGGPEQKRLCELMQDKPVRMHEIAVGGHEQAMLNCLPTLYRVRSANGYCALVPRTLLNLPPQELDPVRDLIADYDYLNPTRGQPAGILKTNLHAGQVVFRWLGSQPRAFRAQTLSLNEVRLTFEPGSPGTLLWTDTYFPGWRAWSGSRELSVKPAPPCFSHIEIPSEAEVVLLRYRPALLPFGMAGVFAGVASLLVMAFLGRRQDRLQEGSASPDAAG